MKLARFLALCFLAGGLFLLAMVAVAIGSPTRSAAVTQEPRLDTIQVAAESLLYEACRGGTLNVTLTVCSGSTLAPRKDPVRRLSLRILRAAKAYRPETVTVIRYDTLQVEAFYFGPPAPPGACTGPECASAVTQHVTNSDSMWFPVAGQDTVTLCAAVRYTVPGGNVSPWFIAWPPVRLRGFLTRDDSVGFTVRGGNPLRVMCVRALNHFGIEAADSASAPQVSWTGLWFPYRGRQLWRPIATLNQ